MIASLAALTITGSTLSPAAAVTVPPAATGYKDFSYASTVAGEASADKPQSKLWFYAGTWWALMVSPTKQGVDVYSLGSNHTWTDTGVVVDTRAYSTGDALMDGDKVYVVSRASNERISVTRLAYNTSTHKYATDIDSFKVASNGSESATIAKDSAGKLWVTYTQGNKVWFTHSTTAVTTFTTPAVVPVGATDVATDDISAVVSVGGKIGILWSNQSVAGGRQMSFEFALHTDGAADSAANWSLEHPMVGTSDDHINLKSIATDPQGRLYAAVKTAATPQDPKGTPVLEVLTRSKTGGWTTVVASRAEDSLTRANIVLDETNNVMYLVAAAPEGGGAIYYKTSPLDNLSFAAGRGTPLIADAPSAAAEINDPSTAKEPVNAASGLVVLASDSTSKTYYHNELTIAGNQTLPASIAPTAGSGQQARIGHQLVTALRATVLNGTGHPAPGALVTFAAPAVGGTFAGGAHTATATTNAAGVATAPAFTASTTAGAYAVTATVTGVDKPATFNLTNAHVEGTYNPLTLPTRLLDTRVSHHAGTVGPHATRTLKVTGVGKYPVPAGAKAVVLNVTADKVTRAGFVTVYPGNKSLPTASNLNTTRGRITPNLVTVPVGTGSAAGTVKLYNGSSAALDLVVDVQGWVGTESAAADGSRFHAVDPKRMLDTRNGTGLKGSLAAKRVTTLQVAGVGSTPAVPLGATAVVVNLTAPKTSYSGFLTAYAAGTAQPTVSNLNLVPEAVANLAIVPLSADGKVAFYAGTSGPLPLVMDVQGYFTGPGTAGDRFIPNTVPKRDLDTRPHPQAAHSTRSLAPTSPPPGATAVVANYTEVDAKKSGYLTIFPGTGTAPVVSNLNFTTGIVPGLAFTKMVGGRVSLYNGSSGTINEIADVQGFFTSLP